MEDYLCDECNNAILDLECFVMVNGIPGETNAILCDCKDVKDRYYNRYNKNKKARVNGENEPPIFIGNAHEYCRGINFIKTDRSIFETMNDDE